MFWFICQVPVRMAERVLTAWVPTYVCVRPVTRVPAARLRLMSVRRSRVRMVQLVTTTSTLSSVTVFAASAEFTARSMMTIAQQGQPLQSENNLDLIIHLRKH